MGGLIKAGWQKPCGKEPPRRERMCRRRNASCVSPTPHYADRIARRSGHVAFRIDRRVPRQNRVARVAASRVPEPREPGRHVAIGRGAYRAADIIGIGYTAPRRARGRNARKPR